jgi:hypothetical protein
MYSLMHIGDLHRSKTQPISNVELVAALAADRDNYINETMSVPYPDAIVVSGDLVQGVPLDSPEYPSALMAQYNEAADFLARLTDEFLDGDRSRLVIVPGNHDVNWNKARAGMQAVEIEHEDVQELLIRPRSQYRWSWKTRTLFKIADFVQYHDRFCYFEECYRRFYENAQLLMPVDPKRPWNLFIMHDGKLLVCGFNSCSMNDCFNQTGEIPPEAISESYMEIRRFAGTCRLSVAVWHHDTQGPPQRSDYMDSDTLALLLAKGYCLGMHGHQHRFEALPYTLYISEREAMAVVSTGSLCAGHSELPTGSNRSYTVVAIDENQNKARVHVREMVHPGVFGPARLLKAGGRTYIDVQWSEPNQSRLVNTGVEGGHALTVLDGIEQAVAAGNYDEALGRSIENRAFLGNHARPLLLEVLYKAQQWSDLAHEIGAPRNPDELMKLIAACFATKDWPRVEKSIDKAVDTQMITPELARDLYARTRAEKGSMQ